MKTDAPTAKLFMHGRSQAVRLPKEFRLPGKEVRVRRVGHGILLQPIERNAKRVRAILDEIERYRSVPFMESGREQPPMPPASSAPFDE
ncbi:MAG TPA: AbrB/MazE/SpoVT family DNA-binding domain-containing protein [Rhizomicrobium sp.]